MSTRWFLLRCEDCEMNLPFPDHATRSEWLDGHMTTGHQRYLLWMVERGSDE